MNRIGSVALAIALGSASMVALHAQSSGGSYAIPSSVIAGGGDPIAGGSYQITSTLGQPATAILSGSTYVIVDGFWSPVGGAALGDSIFADGFELN